VTLDGKALPVKVTTGDGFMKLAFEGDEEDIICTLQSGEMHWLIEGIHMAWARSPDQG